MARKTSSRDFLDGIGKLAEEFRQIGDMEGARDLLQEVVSKASGSLKSKAQGIVYGALDIVKEKKKDVDSLEVFLQALENAKAGDVRLSTEEVKAIRQALEKHVAGM